MESIYGRKKLHLKMVDKSDIKNVYWCFLSGSSTQRVLRILQSFRHPNMALNLGYFWECGWTNYSVFFARTFYNPRLKNSLVSFFEIVLFNSTFWAFKETVLRMGHFRMHAKIISSINLHQYVASGLTEKLTEQFFEIL